MTLRTEIVMLSGVLALAACSSAGTTARDPAAPVPDRPAADNPEAMQHGPKAYVGLFMDNAVAVVDTGTHEVIKKIAVPAGPHGLVVTPDGRKVYVSSDAATTVSVISTSTDEIVDSIEVGSAPHGLTITPDGSKVVLCDFGADETVVIDTATDKVLLNAPVARPHNSAVSLDGARAFVASQQMDTPAIAIVDLASGVTTSSVPIEHAPRALDYAPSRRVYFTVSGVDALEVLDPASGKLGTPIPTGGSPHHVKATLDGEYELVVSQTAGDLEYVDPESATVIARVPTGSAPHWIALSSDGRFAYVTNESSNTLSVVDIEQKKVVDTLSVGNGPRKVAVQPGKVSDASGGSSAQSPVVEVRTTDAFAFSPAHVTIPLGGTVRWVNPGPVPHTVTSGLSSRPQDSPAALFDAPLGHGASFEQAFDTVGDQPYFCRYHEGMGMKGVVTVTL